MNREAKGAMVVLAMIDHGLEAGATDVCGVPAGIHD
jgi:hypothetical protein